MLRSTSPKACQPRVLCNSTPNTGITHISNSIENEAVTVDAIETSAIVAEPVTEASQPVTEAPPEPEAVTVPLSGETRPVNVSTPSKPMPTKRERRAAKAASGAEKPATSLIRSLLRSGTPGQQAGKQHSPNASKPVSGKAAAKAAKLAQQPSKPAAEPAKPSGNVTRTAATIARNATNFGGLSDRDAAYLAFYASFAKRPGYGGKPVTIRDIHESGRGPAYNGSAKPHDAGVINRLRKAGLLNVAADGTSFTFTKLATTHKAYSSAK